MVQYLLEDNPATQTARGITMTDAEQKRIFSANLNRLINESGHTRKELADILEFNYKTFNGWCNGISMPTMGKVQKIADYFHLKKSDLIDFQQSENTDSESDNMWYLDRETAELAQELKDNPELRILLDAARDVRPEDLRVVQATVDALRRKERHED